MIATAPDTEEFRDHIATVGADGKRIWLYPKKPSGRLTSARHWASYVYIAIFLTLPFIKIGGEPFFMLNVVERRFILWGLAFGPQDFYLFGLAMLTFLVFIILFTVVFGRLFCGWACPQTVFMELVFRRIEYAIEGDHSAQKRLNEGPWTPEKLRKKTLKHAIFLAIAVIVANWFLAYIIGMDEVRKIVSEPVGQHAGGFAAMLLFSLIFYGVFAFLREQVCVTICPYGRLQGVLLVKETIVVAYDFIRGEPRGKLKKQPAAAPKPVEAMAKAGGEGMAFSLPVVSNLAAEQPVFVEKKHHEHGDGTNCTGKCDDCKSRHEDDEVPEKNPVQTAFSLAELSEKTRELGDCIDCKLCIQVCPTGIDIRNGTQLECVNCTACIDACDEVMDKISRPRGLIRYDSQTGIAERRRRIFTPRATAYSALLVALVGLDVFMFSRRAGVDMLVLRTPGMLFQQVDSTHITNLYNIEIVNKTARDCPVELVLATPGGVVRPVGKPFSVVPKGENQKGEYFVEFPTALLHGRKNELTFQLFSNGKLLDEGKTNFLGPGRRDEDHEKHDGHDDEEKTGPGHRDEDHEKHDDHDDGEKTSSGHR